MKQVSVINYYKGFKIREITTPKYCHILLLLFWACYAISYIVTERFLNFDYHIIETAFDYKIPFCEIFVIPYVFWYVYLALSHIYTFFCDVPVFKKLMKYLIISFSIATVVYLVYPTVQLLRPTEFPRDNFLTDVVKALYIIDTSTNICPSLHVIGSFGCLFAIWHAKGLNSWIIRTIFVVITLLICASTVLIKQHSIIDVFWGIVVSVFVYIIVFKTKKSGAGEFHNKFTG